MKEIVSDLWTFHDAGYYVCIPTNGYLKKNGSNVMGAGLASQCKERFPDVEWIVGDLLKHNGNIPQIISKYRIITYPTKPPSFLLLTNTDLKQVIPRYRYSVRLGDVVPGWMCKSDLAIIQNSDFILKNYLPLLPTPVYVPQVGCGAGELQWTDVKQVLKPIFKDDPRVIFVRRE